MDNPNEIFPFEGLAAQTSRLPDTDPPAQILTASYGVVRFPIYDTDLLLIAENRLTEGWNAYTYPLGSTEWCKRGGASTGSFGTQKPNGQNAVFGDTAQAGVYTVFPAKWPRHMAYKLATGNKYRIERLVTLANEGLDVYGWNPFLESVCTLYNSQGFPPSLAWQQQWWDIMDTAGWGLFEDSTTVETTPFVFAPRFTLPASSTVLRKITDWNASANLPDILAWPPEGLPPLEEGDAFFVSTAGTTEVSGINDWQLGDVARYVSGGTWEKVQAKDFVVDCLPDNTFRAWNSLLQPEQPRNGNTGLDPSAFIDQVYLSTDERTLGKRFSNGYDWPTQKRDFYPVGNRLGELYDHRLIRVPSWEFGRTFSTFTGNERNDAFGNFGDIVWMGWQPIADDEKNINVVCRYRWPQNVILPYFKASDFGLPEYFDWALLTTPSQTFGPSAFTIFNGSIRQRVAGWYMSGSTQVFGFDWDENLWGMVEEHRRTRTTTDWRPPASFLKTVWTEKNSPSDWFSTAELAEVALHPEWPLPGLDLASYGALATSPQECAKLGPPRFQLRGMYWSGPEDRNSWSISCAKVVDTFEDDGVTPATFKYQPIFATHDGSATPEEAMELLSPVATWATAYLCDPAKFVQVGRHCLRDASAGEGEEQVVASTPLFGHVDFYSSVEISVYIES